MRVKSREQLEREAELLSMFRASLRDANHPWRKWPPDSPYVPGTAERIHWTGPVLCALCREYHKVGVGCDPMVLQRRKKEEVFSGDLSKSADPGKAWTKFPHVLEFLSTRSWPDGSKRVTGTLTVYTEGMDWKASLKCRDTAGIAFVTAATLEALFDTLESQLKADVVEWRDDKFAGGSGKRRG